MDEAFVVLVVEPSIEVCAAFPFATKAGATAAERWFRGALGAAAQTTVIDDHDRDGDDDLAKGF